MVRKLTLSITVKTDSVMESQVGGLEVSEAKRLKTLEDENTRLKRLLADAMLDNAALKDLVGKKW
jgi:putative transposase